MTPLEISWRYVSVNRPTKQKGTKRIDAIRVRTIFTYCGDFATNYGSRRDHRNLTTYQHGRANLMSGGNAMMNWSSSSLLLNWAAEKRTLLEDEGGAHPELSAFSHLFRSTPLRGSRRGELPSAASSFVF